MNLHRRTSATLLGSVQETGDDFIDSKQERAYFPSPYLVEHHSLFSDSLRNIRNSVKIEQWHRVRQIGRGGFGDVFLERERGGALRAVKEIPKMTAGTRTIGYLREILAMAKFSQYEGYFVQLQKWFQTDDRIFIAMEYAPWGDLSMCVEQSLPEVEAQSISIQITEALAIMHEKKFTHRDLKPSNVFVISRSPVWWVKLGDFGVSKRVRNEITGLHSAIEGDYSAPEMFGIVGDVSEQPSTDTSAVDMWSLGFLIHWLLTHRVPLTRRQLIPFCLGKLSLPLEYLTERNVTHQALDLIETLLLPDPDTRLSAPEALKHDWLHVDVSITNTERHDISDICLPDVWQRHEFAEPYARPPGRFQTMPPQGAQHTQVITQASHIDQYTVRHVSFGDLPTIYSGPRPVFNLGREWRSIEDLNMQSGRLGASNHADSTTTYGSSQMGPHHTYQRHSGPYTIETQSGTPLTDQLDNDNFGSATAAGDNVVSDEPSSSLRVAFPRSKEVIREANQAVEAFENPVAEIASIRNFPTVSGTELNNSPPGAQPTHAIDYGDDSRAAFENEAKAPDFEAAHVDAEHPRPGLPLISSKEREQKAVRKDPSEREIERTAEEEGSAQVRKIGNPDSDGKTAQDAQIPSSTGGLAGQTIPPAEMELKVLQQFREFADSEKQKLLDKKRASAAQDMTRKLNELLQFSKTFKLKNPPPADILGILAKDPVKQERIIVQWDNQLLMDVTEAETNLAKLRNGQPFSVARSGMLSHPVRSTQLVPAQPRAMVSAAPSGTGTGSQTAAYGKRRDIPHNNTSKPPSVPFNNTTLGFIRNVNDKVDALALRQVLERYGPMKYFDVSRPKKCAFVEFETREDFHNALSNSPLWVGSELVHVEERRSRPGGRRQSRR